MLEFFIGIFGTIIGALLLVSGIIAFAGVQEREIDPATPVILCIIGLTQIATGVIIVADRM